MLQQIDILIKRAIHVLFLLIIYSYSSVSIAQENDDLATLNVFFPDLSSVHTEIRASDNLAGSATGTLVKRSNWKTDKTSVQVNKGLYDLVIKKGAGKLIIDDVDCRMSSCSVDQIVAILTIDFDGLSSVHSSVHIPDDIQGTVSGSHINKKNWQTNQTVFPILRQIVDVNIRKGGGNIVVDNLDCRSGTCNINDITSKLTVSFPDMSSIHTAAYVSDNIVNSVSGKEITHKNWQKDQAVITVLKQVIDLKIQKNTETLYLDNIDCSSGHCSVDNLTATLTVNFPGLSSMHSSVYAADDNSGSVSGERITHKNWQKNQATIKVFKNLYDVKIFRNKSTPIVVDNVDCSSGLCEINDLTASLTVKFNGINAVHTSIREPDHQSGLAEGNEFSKKNWQTDQTVITVLRQVYDAQVRRNHSAPIIIDEIDCRSGTCLIDQLTATLTVSFPEMSSVHTAVFKPDNIVGSTTEKAAFSKNWQKNQAKITVFKQLYDIKVKRNNSTPLIFDKIDCTSGSCAIDDITATLTVNFPKMNGIHTSVFSPDGKPGSTLDKPSFKLNWQSNQATLQVFKQFYDIQVKNSHSEPIYFDNLDCTSGNCSIDDITATLTVKFPHMSSVHTSVYIPDNTEGSANGKKAFKLNWQKEQAEITVFKQIYDISVQKGKSEPMIIDNIDCTEGSCLVDGLTANLVVDFPALHNVHTSILIPDHKAGIASGQEVTKLNWQKEHAKISVFRQLYDVKIRHGQISKIIDDLDCTSGECHISDITTRLTIEFPGLQNVHSSVHIVDGQDNSASGKLIKKSNWQTHQTVITLLKETYDVKVQHSIESIFDNVDCNEAECKVLITGNVQAELIDGDTNKPLANTSLSAYEKLSDGTLNKITRGKTTVKGQVNFTLEGISSGKIYVLKAYNPFGNYKNFYSAFINKEGKYSFIITADGENSLDLTPPEISISTPQDGSNVTNLGFQVTGSATDNRTIDKIELTIEDVATGKHSIETIFNQDLLTWTANIPATMVSLNNTSIITATAFDKAQNQSSTSSTVSVIEDSTGPEINILSHSENDQVAVTGFLLSGSVTDLTGVASLKATLIDSSLGETISDQAIAFSITNGTWTLVIDNGLMTENGTVSINLSALDTVGNAALKTIQLLAIPIDYSNAHMINRITFGATPSLIQETNTLGALNLLEQQLDPNSIDDSSFSALISNSPTTKEELQAWTIQHMAFSNRQLLEVMTWFWDNHFNTNINTKRTNAQGVEISNTVEYELAENIAFRNNALGNFRDLLEISAKSPAMLIYLDSISNVADDSNENYPRELKELHTMGVDGGYTDQDVEIAAEVFTGWHIQNNAFFFDNALHSIGSYILFEDTLQQVLIPEGGVIQGNMLLDALAEHPSTAKFICTKLITVFVNDVTPETLVTRCAEEFLNFSQDDNQIQHVLRLIMQSAEFNDIAHYRSKIKTPVKFVVGAIRNFEASTNATDLISPLRSIGIRLYENPVPTGWSEIGADWMNANLLIERIKWANTLVRNEPSSNGSFTTPLQFYPNQGFETADGIVGFLFQLTLGDDFTDLARNNALSVLGTSFDILNPDAELRLRQLNGTVMSYPQYQFQ